MATTTGAFFEVGPLRGVRYELREISNCNNLGHTSVVDQNFKRPNEVVGSQINSS